MIGLLGIVVLLGIAVAMSNNRKKINLRILGWGLGLQLTFALFILKTPIGKPVFGFLDKAISKLISFSDAGGNFLLLLLSRMWVSTPHLLTLPFGLYPQ